MFQFIWMTKLILIIAVNYATFFPLYFNRKSWLVPTQYLLGLFMLYLSVTVNSLLESEAGRGPSIVTLTVVFFMLAFLAATQVGIHTLKYTHILDSFPLCV